MAKNGRLLFPTRTASILHGVTQVFLLECASSIGVDVKEELIHIDTLRAADEVFMSGTLVEALGITSIDDQPIGNGQVGPITQRLYEEFQRRLRRGETADG